MKLRKNFWGNRITLVIGILSLLSGLSLIAQGQENSNVEAGIIIICSAIAYASVKKRRLGIKRSSKFSYVLEAVCLGIIGLIMLAGLLAQLMFNDPVPFIVIPLIGIVAYKVAYDGTSSDTTL